MSSTNMSTSTTTSTAMAAPRASDAAPASGATMSAVEYDVTGVVTSRAYIVGCTLPGVEHLVSAVKRLRGAGATEDVIGLAVPLAGDPSTGEVLLLVRQEDAHEAKRGFNLMEFLMNAMDPHRPQVRGPWKLGPGRNAGVASEVLGDVTRYMVGIQTFRIPLGEPPNEGNEFVWTLARPNHAAAMQKLPGDSQEGFAGMMATLGVPHPYAAEYVKRLAAGECLLTTCETDEGRMKRDQKIMRAAGALHMMEPLPLTVEYGVRRA